MNWDDLRYLLAVIRDGSLSRAASSLGVNPTTVTRRLQALEEDAGVRLFDRLRRGIELTQAGKEFVQTARAVEQQMMLLDAKTKGQESELSGSLQVSMLDFIGVLWADALHEFTQKYPELRLEINTGMVTKDLIQRESDVSIRMASSPDERLVGRKIGRVGHAVYGSEELLQRHEYSTDLSSYPWMDWNTGSSKRPETWLQKTFPTAKIVGRVDVVPIMVEYLQRGTGLATLPCMIGDGYPTLRRLQRVDFGLDLWLLTHPELHKSPKVRVFFDHMLEVFSEWKERIEG